MPPRFCVTVLTYNRAATLSQNLPSYMALNADLLQIVDNGSTDHTFKVVTQAFEENDFKAGILTRNRINLGYARSLVKSFFLCEQSYQLILSDEDVPNPTLLTMYRTATEQFGKQGAILRATPYPKSWLVPELDAQFVLHDDENYTVIAPGLYAAYLASFQSVYVGGLCIAPDAVKNAHWITLEQGSYPQRFLASDAAFSAGLVLVKSERLGQFPGAFASKKNEAMTPRNGDWGVAEYVSTAQFLLDFYPRNNISTPAYHAMRECLLRFAYTRVPIYFTKVAAHGYEPALRFMEAVGRSSDVFSMPLFWSMAYAYINKTFDPKMKAMFRACCRALEPERYAASDTSPNAYVHQHHGFGRL